MSKKGKKDKQGKKAKVREVVNPDLPVEQTDSEAPAAPAKKMSNRAYLKELEKLEAELVHLQSWVIEKGLKVVISSKAVTAPARAVRSRPSPAASARASSGSSPCPHRPIGRRPRCTSSAICRTCRLPARW
jgi:hypothetical protein